MRHYQSMENLQVEIAKRREELLDKSCITKDNITNLLIEMETESGGWPIWLGPNQQELEGYFLLRKRINPVYSSMKK
jgi:hypothetical protein